MSICGPSGFFKTRILSLVPKKILDCCTLSSSLKKRVFDISSAALSAAGNWSFYGVAYSFGSRYSSVFGSLLGASEVTSYFLFRIQNFQEIRKQLFGYVPSGNRLMLLPTTHSASSVSGEKEQISLSDPSSAEENSADTPRSRSSSWKNIALKTIAATLGIVAQFPLMVLVYYGNNENLAYPVITGMCEGAFTVLSLLMGIRSSQRFITPAEDLDPEIERKKAIIIEQTNRFLEELPVKYKDPQFVARIDEIFSDSAQYSEEQRGKAVLDLILEAEGLAEIKKGPWDNTLSKMATGLGILIAGYLTTVNGAVTYQGIMAWKPDQKALAIIATIFVGLTNLQLLNRLCIDSAKSYYESLRDFFKGQSRPSLAQAISPVSWFIGRTIATVLSWSSFGTTALSARDYVPQAGTTLIGLAPLSSTLLLRESLQRTSDDLVLRIGSHSDPTKAKFRELYNAVEIFKEGLPRLDQESLQQMFSQLPNLQELKPRPRLTPNDKTPLISNLV